MIQRIADNFNAGTVDAIKELVSPDLAGFVSDLAALKQAFPDAHFAINDILGEGDKLADRYTITGTHQQPYLGVAPTGRKIDVAGISIVRISGGKITERSAVIDQLGLLQQLGVLPHGFPRTAHQ